MQNKKKVLYCITKSVWGGAQRYVFDLATHLSKDQFGAAIAAGGNGALFEKCNKNGVPTICLPHAERNVHSAKEVKMFYALVKLFFSENPDIIHLNSSKMGALGSCAAFFYNGVRFFCFRPPARVIFTAHGWGFMEARPWWQKKLIYFLSWFSSLLQQKIIVINTADFRAAQKFIPQKKLIFIPNGIECPVGMEKSEAQKLLFSPPLRKDTFVIGTIAELTKNKGIPYLLEAIDSARKQTGDIPIRACIVGEGEERASLERQIDSLGLNDIVRLTGFFKDAHLLMNGFDLFVLPSLKEGLPYVIMEAMATGLPVIATRVGGIPDLILHEKNGVLVEKENREMLAGAIVELLCNKKKRDALGREAQNHMETNFQLRDMVKKIEDLYASV